jgi:hypothetical protein
VLSSVLFFPPAESRLFSFLFFFFPAVLLDEFDLEKEPNRQKRDVKAGKKEGRRVERAWGLAVLRSGCPFRIAPFPDCVPNFLPFPRPLVVSLCSRVRSSFSFHSCVRVLLVCT